MIVPAGPFGPPVAIEERAGQTVITLRHLTDAGNETRVGFRLARAGYARDGIPSRCALTGAPVAGTWAWYASLAGRRAHISAEAMHALCELARPAYELNRLAA